MGDQLLTGMSAWELIWTDVVVVRTRALHSFSPGNKKVDNAATSFKTAIEKSSNSSTREIIVY
jgi:hypothetical protein